MIYSRFGGRIRILAIANEAHHRAAGEVPIRKSDRERIAAGLRVVFAFDGDGSEQHPKDDGTMRVADVAFLRADGGYGEIEDAILAVRTAAVFVFNETPPTLDAARRHVGGPVEMLRLHTGDQLLVNEEGQLRGLPHNAEASRLAGRPVVGNAMLLAGAARWT